MPKKMMKKSGARKGYRGKRNYRKKLAIGRAIANYNADTFKTTSTWIADVKTVSTDGGLTNYLYFDACALTGFASLANSQQFFLYKKIFDQYRVTGVTMSWKPKITQLTGLDTTTVPELTPNFDNIIWSAFDQDSPVPSSEKNIQVNRSCRRHKFTSAFKRSFRYKYPNGTWLDTSTNYQADAQGNVNPAIKMTGLYAHYGFYAQNIPAPMGAAPVNVGQVQITYHLVFRGQSFNNVGYDPEVDVVVIGANEPPMRPLSDVTKHTTIQTVTVTGLTNQNTDPITH